MKKKIIIFLLVLGIIYNFFKSYKLFDFKKILNNKFDLKKYEKLYNQSQWVISKSKNPIGDDILYTYAGTKYILGENIILINSEHPPLGKNLIGLSGIYLKNEYYFSLLSGILTIFSFYLLTTLVLKEKLISLLLSIFLFFEPVFVVNYFLTLLDLLTFSFLNFYFYFLIKSTNSKNYLLIFLSNFFLGLIISTKFYALWLPIFLTTIVYFFVNKNLKTLIYYLFGQIITLTVFILNYFQYFARGYNFIDFLKLQKYIFIFNQEGRKEFVFLNNSLFLLLFKGEFFINLKQTIKESLFSIFWPISTIITLISFFIKKIFLSPITLWIIIYSLTQIYSITNVRYLMLLIPYLYLTSIFILKPYK